MDDPHKLIADIVEGVGLPRDEARENAAAVSPNAETPKPALRKSRPPRKQATNDLVTEDNAAREFERRYRGELLYCHEMGGWLEWDGSIWRRARKGKAFEWARQISRERAKNEPDRVRFIAGKAAFAAAVERFAQNDEAFAVEAMEFDKDPMLLGTPGGTIELSTGALRKSDPADRITKATSVVPADLADCPRWTAFLEEATGGDIGLIRSLQQRAGYYLTGLTKEQELAFLYGGGGEGKSTFVNALVEIMGDYSATAPMETFTASRSDRHPTDLAMLCGVRLVTASEVEQGRYWDEPRIKQLTGGDPISARFMRQDYFTYVPQFKLMIVGNHRPALRNVDAAMRRRINIIPFTRKPARPDPDLPAKLRAEAPEILRWAIDGALDWQKHGLSRPRIVEHETEEYFSDQDTFSQWLDEECDCEPDNVGKVATSKELFDSWKAYAVAANEHCGSHKSFSENLTKRGLEKRRGSKGVRLFRGICLRRVTGDTR